MLPRALTVTCAVAVLGVSLASCGDDEREGSVEQSGGTTGAETTGTTGTTGTATAPAPSGGSRTSKEDSGKGGDDSRSSKDDSGERSRDSRKGANDPDNSTDGTGRRSGAGGGGGGSGVY